MIIDFTFTRIELVSCNCFPSIYFLLGFVMFQINKKNYKLMRKGIFLLKNRIIETDFSPLHPFTILWAK